MSKTIREVAVIGDGGWGTTLAIHLFHKGLGVRLWGPFPEYVRTLDKNRLNTKFLPGIKIPKGIRIYDCLETAIEGTNLVILAIPSKFALKIIRQLKPINLSNKIVLSVIKGIEESSLKTISQVITEELGPVPLAVLSGPNIAREVALEMPSTAVIACKDTRLGQKLQSLFNSESFRIYKNSDVLGVELGGSIKNIIAIACGVCDGLGLGTNAQAAIVTRGLSEMTRLGIALGAQQKTFYGLSGLGDMATTCMNPQSRNRSVGERLGKGQSIGRITSSMAMVAEGVTTVKAILNLGKRNHVVMPITEEVYNIIYKNKNPLRAVRNLMTRKLKSE